MGGVGVRACAWLALLAALVAVSCGADEEDDSVRLAFYPADDEPAFMDALLGGVVEVDGPCFHLVSSDGSRTFVAFPDGEAVWDEEQQSVFLRGGRIEAGKPVTIAGGYSDGRDFGEWPVAPDDSCDTSRLWLAADVGPTAN